MTYSKHTLTKMVSYKQRNNGSQTTFPRHKLLWSPDLVNKGFIDVGGFLKENTHFNDIINK